MSTTTIRIPDDLKARVVKAAKRAGTTPHNYILGAIAERTTDDERRADFLATAERRYRQIIASGETISWERMRTYITKRLEGKKVRRPRPRKLDI